MHADEKDDFRRELGVSSDGLDDLIKSGYRMLDLISYFTTGEDETRAWTIKNGFTAPQAAGVIHTDFEEKFIRAEVIGYDAFIARRGALIAALMMVTSVLLGVEVRLAKTDAMLLLTCVAAMGAMARVRNSTGTRDP